MLLLGGHKLLTVCIRGTVVSESRRVAVLLSTESSVPRPADVDPDDYVGRRETVTNDGMGPGRGNESRRGRSDRPVGQVGEREVRQSGGQRSDAGRAI